MNKKVIHDILDAAALTAMLALAYAYLVIGCAAQLCTPTGTI